MSDNLNELISSPVVPLTPEWQSPTYQAEAKHARALHDESSERYWSWVGEQLRWIRRYDTLVEGDLSDFRYYGGGAINVADNCVNRWAENPATRDKYAVVWEGEPGDIRKVTYAELADEVGRLAAGLAELGVERGDVVAIYLPNMVEAFAAIHACNHIGAIYTVIFAGFSEEASRSRLEQAEPKVVVVADASYRRTKLVPLLDTLRRARRSVPSVQNTIVVDRTGRGVALEEGEIDYRELVQRQPGPAPMAEMDANDPAFLIFTSGTESKPKGIVHSAGGFLAGTWSNVHWQVGPEQDDVYWVAADVGWLTFPIQAVVGGLANGMTIACYEGALDTPTQDRFYEICEKHSVTKILAAPTVLRMLRQFGDELMARHPLPQLKLVTTQGELLDSDTFGWTNTRFAGGVPVVNAYGQTETGSTWTYPIYGVDDMKAGSVGVPTPGHLCLVVDDSGNPVPPGIKGNLVLTHPFPTLARTVWKDHQRFLDTYFSRFPGYYATSDEAVIDHDGHIWILGRSDDVINIAAHRISTMEIEEIVNSHPQVIEAAVVGVPHATKGTVPAAFIVIKDDDQERIIEQIRVAVSDQLGRYAALEHIYVTANVPKTRTGKLMRRLLRDVATYGEPRGDTSSVEDHSAIEAVTQAVAAVDA
ncbi:AMP-binding protein [Nocardia australiensis]|uniref:AMP-binding protein n=1 Tax=Nocardia australiensis TaxID=2887191 RepID=UPI001D135D28|nr:AMP-binding protein [Nocardia australiensis]